jgi:hypothetical protein
VKIRKKARERFFGAISSVRALIAGLETARILRLEEAGENTLTIMRRALQRRAVSGRNFLVTPRTRASARH